MTCDDIEEYLDGALTRPCLGVFEEHLKSCPACALECRRQSRLDRALSAAARHLPPASTRLRDRIDRDVKALESRQRTLTRWKFAAAILISAVGLALGLALGIGLALGPRLDRDGRPDEQAEVAPEVEVAEDPLVVEVLPDAEPIATVVLGDGENALAVPVRTENANATIVFVYPVFGGDSVRDGAE